MSSEIEKLAEQFGVDLALLDDIAAYFQRIGEEPLSGNESTEVNLLPLDKCIARTEDMDCHPLFDSDADGRFLVLDDANTSDHHCYALDFPYPGCVIFVPHGDTVRIAFRNTVELVKSCELAIETDTPLTDYHRTDLVLHPDQDRLHSILRRLAKEGPEELLCLFVSSYDMTDDSLTEEIMNIDDVYIRSAVAERIATGPKREYYDLASRCAHDSHPNVWRPGRRALGAVEAILSENGVG